MPTEQPALKIRRANPLDAVNLFRLLVDEEKKNGLEVEFDEAARLAHILHVIVSGYVSVVEKSGRIIGSLGFAARDLGYVQQKYLDGEWFALTPSLQKSQVPVRLIERAVNFADMHKVSIRVHLPPGLVGQFKELLERENFQAYTTQFIRGAVDVDDEAEPAVQPTTQEVDATEEEPDTEGQLPQ